MRYIFAEYIFNHDIPKNNTFTGLYIYRDIIKLSHTSSVPYRVPYININININTYTQESSPTKLRPTRLARVNRVAPKIIHSIIPFPSSTNKNHQISAENALHIELSP